MDEGSRIDDLVESAKRESWQAHQAVLAARKEAIEELKAQKVPLTITGLMERLKSIETLLWEVLDRG